MSYAAARGFLIFGTALAAAGCTQDAARWSEVEAPKENTVAFTTIDYIAQFAPGAATLSGDQLQALERFASASIHPGDHVIVELGRPTPGLPEGFLAKRQAALRLQLAKLPGRPSFEIVRTTGAAPPASDTAVLRVGGYVVTPPRCPNWTKPESDDYTNSSSSNFGCADVTNIGLMVADPGDLVRGVAGGGADAAFAARGVTLYRSGAISKSLAAVTAAQGTGAGGEGGQGGGSPPGGGN
jgi:type IV pilus biogenesis protein CpaD/CtpE